MVGIGTSSAPSLGAFPTLVYIGHPGWKSVGCSRRCLLGRGLVILLLGVLGLLPILLNIIPLVATSCAAHLYRSCSSPAGVYGEPRRHAPAVALALIPWIANFVQNQVDSALVQQAQMRRISSPGPCVERSVLIPGWWSWVPAPS